MKIDGVPHRSIWFENGQVNIIDQRWLPHEFRIEILKDLTDAAAAIKEMHVRGAPLIGITAAYGLYLAAKALGNAADFDQQLMQAGGILNETRPTAVNLAWAIEQQMLQLENHDSPAAKTQALLENAHRLADEDVEQCRMIGVHGLEILRSLAAKNQGQPLNILTHCNAGWLACTDFGTATSPMYQAHDAGIPIHVWVDEPARATKARALRPGNSANTESHIR